MKDVTMSRRVMVKSAAFGLLAVSLPTNASAFKILDDGQDNEPDLHPEYPALNPELVSETVGVSHFDLDRLKALIELRPELANASWDWGFGDRESAIGAASHVGRRDIVQFLIENGAKPTLFTFAMLGEVDIVKSILSYSPDMKNLRGPHGISLLQHAEIGLYAKGADKEKSQMLLDFLKEEGLTNPAYVDISEEEKQKYLGDYKYGDGPEDGFSIKLNMRKLLALGKIGAFGGALYQVKENEFIYNGTSSVTITFQQQGDKITGLTVNEPGLELKAEKVL